MTGTGGDRLRPKEWRARRPWGGLGASQGAFGAPGRGIRTEGIGLKSGNMLYDDKLRHAMIQR